MTRIELKDFLDEKASFYDKPDFIAYDPICIPHRFSKKEDIEIAGFLTATIAWGNRKSIINNAERLMQLMGNAPHDFIMEYRAEQADIFEGFVHRTFNSEDAAYFMLGLQHLYIEHGGLEAIFANYAESDSLQSAIHQLKKLFFELPHKTRTEKHLADPLKNSAAKRINMFLRWMVRPNKTGVDFGIWKSLKPSQLSCPLDIHSGNVARKLELVHRKQNDAKSLTELDRSLRALDSTDPVKYDFALFGLGIAENF